MTNGNQRFAIDRDKVVCDVVDDEAILIHVETGMYYSLRGAGARIWRDIQAGASRLELVAALSLRHAAPREVLAAGVDALVERLVAEGLVRPSDDPPATPFEPEAAVEVLAFEAPSLERFSDMTDLLLLDPIHEVDPKLGWPARAAGDA